VTSPPRALLSDSPSAEEEKTGPKLLAACVLRALSSNGYTRHNIMLVVLQAVVLPTWHTHARAHTHTHTHTHRNKLSGAARISRSVWSRYFAHRQSFRNVQLLLKLFLLFKYCITLIYFNTKWVFTLWQWYYNNTQQTNNTQAQHKKLHKHKDTLHAMNTMQIYNNYNKYIYNYNNIY
jgi:hypothetical protein